MKTCGVITITTDFGLRDPYVAIMKGVILSINPEVRLIDISHQISFGSILQATIILMESYQYFPKGTIHLVVVDPGVGGIRRPIAVKMDGHYFVGPDNGVFWPIIKNQKGARIIHLTEKKFFLSDISHTFHGRDIFAPVSAHISAGVDLAKMGPVIKNPQKLAFPKPKIKENVLYGQVIKIDNFGNLSTNIHRDDLEIFLQSSRPIITVGNLIIHDISYIYASVDKETPLALFGSSRYLEIAVNRGRASDDVGLKPDKVIGTMVNIHREKAGAILSSI